MPSATLEACTPTELRAQLGDLSPLLDLRTVVAAYLAVEIPVRRPRGLLSPEHLRRCTDAIGQARQVAKPAKFSGLRLSAAGSDTDDLRRFREALSAAIDLPDDPDDGDLLLRLRRSESGSSGWELLVRLTPRPLSARPWRVANYPGALNATIAAGVITATEPTRSDQFIDLMCGSGTLVIERLARGTPDRVVACDLAPDAINAAQANQRAARLRGKVDYLQADIRELPGLLSGRFTTLVANLPWGELVGTHLTNEELYPAVLTAAAALAEADAQFAVLTQDIRRFEHALAQSTQWEAGNTWRFFAKGHRPKLYLLHRTVTTPPVTNLT